MSQEKSAPSTSHYTPGAFEPPNPTPDAGPSSPRQNHLDTLSDSNPHDHNDDSTPPAYSAALSPPVPLRSNPQLRSPGLPNLPYNLYLPPSFTLSSDKTTITSSSAHLSNPGTLLPLITSLCTLPPKPMLRIVGQRMHAPGPDFDIRINLMGLIVGEGERKMNYMKLLGKGETGWRGGVREAAEPDFGGKGEKGLEGWVRAFCGDEAGVKEYVFSSLSLLYLSCARG